MNTKESIFNKDEWSRLRQKQIVVKKRKIDEQKNHVLNEKMMKQVQIDKQVVDLLGVDRTWDISIQNSIQIQQTIMKYKQIIFVVDNGYQVSQHLMNLRHLSDSNQMIKNQNYFIYIKSQTFQNFRNLTLEFSIPSFVQLLENLKQK